MFLSGSLDVAGGADTRGQWHEMITVRWTMTKMQKVFLCASGFRIIPEVTGELLNLGIGQEVIERQG